MNTAQLPRTFEITERMLMLPRSEKLRLRILSDDPEALDALFAVAAHAEWVGSSHQRPADFAMSDEGAADLLDQTRAAMKKRERCQFADHDEYEWHVGFFSQEARANFIDWSRWIGAAITETGIAIPGATAREIAALMRP